MNKYILAAIEHFFYPYQNRSLNNPPIFFLGAPRSGSTLAIQAVTEALDVGYISNKHCKWYGAPALAERLFHPTAKRPPSDYRSKQGDTVGDYAPAECGEWWYRFFRRSPAYVTLNDVDPRRMRQFRRSVAALTNAFDRPILIKNLYASLRIQAIAHYFPESLFVVVHRNEIDNGHSILEARKVVSGNYECWWSIEPPSIDNLKALPPYKQVIEQIRNIYYIINRDLDSANVALSRRFDINYEQLCANPNSIINEFQHFLSQNHFSINRLGVIPSEFPVRSNIRIDSKLYKLMTDYAQRS